MLRNGLAASTFAAFGSLGLTTGVGAADSLEDDGVWFDTASLSMSPDEFQFNAQFLHHDALYGLYAPFTAYRVESDEFHPHFVEDWTVEDGSMTLHLREDFTWGGAGGGDPITADDVVLHLELRAYVDDEFSWFVDGIDAVDDHTVELTFPAGTNPDLVVYSVLDYSLTHPPAAFGDDHDDLVAGDDPSYPGSLQETVVPSGPLELVEETDEYHAYGVRDGHPAAADIDWDGYRMWARESNTDALASLEDGSLDGFATQWSSDDPLPETAERVSVSDGVGVAVQFVHDSEHFRSRTVRRAFMYALDREAIVDDLTAGTAIHHERPTGLSAQSAQRWLGDTLETYDAYEQDHDRVTELLESAGYELVDGTWRRASQSLTVDIATDGQPRWAEVAAEIVSQLSEAGFDATLVVEPDIVHKLVDGDLEADAVVSGFLPGAVFRAQARQHHPYFALLLTLLISRYAPFDYGYPTTVSVPSMTGTCSELVDIEDCFERFETATDPAEQRDIVETLTWVFNQDLPAAVIMEPTIQTVVDRSRWTVPDDSPYLETRAPLWWLALEGDLQPAGDGPDLEINGYTPAPYGDDGLYRDITGDGRVGFNDVVTFFEHHDDATIQDHPDLFDFDGSGRVGFNDVVALFESI
ncbi:hypothetical protein GCM10025298_22220 [Natronobiforma cellulositropha]